MQIKPAAMTAEIVTNIEVAPSQFHMTLCLPQNAPPPAPGQFYMFRTAALHDPLLGRPFSVYNYRVAGDKNFLEILYQVAGRGTSLLSRAPAPNRVEITGPLGRGFTIAGGRKEVVLIAGGMGAAPLSFLADRYSVMTRDKGATVTAPGRIICYLGARTAEALSGAERLASLCGRLLVATDDGTRGFHGNVVELLQQDFASYGPDTAFYACGPTPMLRGLAGLFSGTARSCEASMEERMACGLGACLGCTVTVKGRDDESAFKRVCKDGPVFSINDLLWP